MIVFLQICLGLLGPLSVLAPMALSWMTPFTCVVGTGLYCVRHKRFPGWAGIDRRLLLCTALFLCYAFLSALWSPDPERSLKKAFYLLVLFGSLYSFVPALLSLKETERALLIKAFLYGAFAAMVFFLIEYLFNYPVYHLARGLPLIEEVKPSVFNKTMTIWAVLIWLVAGVFREKYKTPLMIVFLLLFFAMTTLFQSNSAVLGMGTGLVVWGVARSVRVFRPYLLPCMLMATIVGIVPLTYILYQTGWITYDHWDVGLRQRIEIWYFAAEQWRNAPILGWGLDTFRAIPTAGYESHFAKDLTGGFAMHPHNASLQILVELGLVGMLLAASLIFFLFQKIRDPYLLAATVSAFAIAHTASGLWQGWWLGFLGMVVMLMTLYTTRKTQGV